MENPQTLLKVNESDFALSTHYYCPLIAQYFPTAKNWRSKINCPLASKCQHPKC